MPKQFFQSEGVLIRSNDLNFGIERQGFVISKYISMKVVTSELFNDVTLNRTSLPPRAVGSKK